MSSDPIRTRRRRGCGSGARGGGHRRALILVAGYTFYNGVPAPSFDDYATAILDGIRPSGLPLVIELGRAIVDLPRAGRPVVDVKAQPGDKHFVVLDVA